MLDIDYITTEAQCLELHGFLCVIAQPVLFGPIEPKDSLPEVLRVARDGVSLVARIDGEIVGALGLTAAELWYNHKLRFLTDRWFFVYPQFANLGIGARLLGEAAAVASKAELDLVINGKLNRRARGTGRGIAFTHPTVVRHGSPEKQGASVH